MYPRKNKVYILELQLTNSLLFVLSSCIQVFRKTPTKSTDKCSSSSQDELVVGDPNCRFSDVVTALDIRNSEKLCKNLFALAKTLDVDAENITRLRKQLNMEIYTYTEAFHDILSSWRAKKSRHATLQKLVFVLQSHNLRTPATRLMKQFKLNIPPNQLKNSRSWYSNFQMPFAILLAVSIVAFSYYVTENEDDNWRKLPSNLPYYKSRHLRIRGTLDTHRIFWEWTNDIFLISGMEMSDLHTYISPDRCDYAENQLRILRRIQAQSTFKSYMILDTTIDFYLISNKTDKSVHWIHFNDTTQTMNWRKTKGSITTIQLCLSDTNTKPDSLSENELVHQLITGQLDSTIIYGNPGNGKTSTLLSIANSMVKSQPDLSYLYITGVDLVFHLETLIDSAIAPENLISIRCGSCYTKKPSVFQNLGERSKFWVFIDGFDQIPSQKTEVVRSLLRKIMDTNVTSLIITTRPRHQLDIEISINALGHEILPLDSQHFSDLLLDFWKYKEPSLNSHKIAEFADKTVKTFYMHSAFDYLGQNALHATLIAEFFLDDAIRNNNTISPNVKDRVSNIPNLAELYDYMISTKLRDIQNQSHAYNVLAFLSVESLFSEIEEILNLILPSGTLNSTDMDIALSTGLVYENTIYNMGVEFVHETFAEYFVAWFLIDRIQTNNWNNFSECAVLYRYLLKDVFRTDKCFWNIEKCILNGLEDTADPNFSRLRNKLLQCDGSDSPFRSIFPEHPSALNYFVFEHIPYFMNHLLANINQTPNKPKLCKQLCPSDQWYLAYVLISGDYVNLLKLFWSSLTEYVEEPSNHFITLPLAIGTSGNDMLTFLNNHISSNATMRKLFLLGTVHSGNYDAFVHLCDNCEREYSCFFHFVLSDEHPWCTRKNRRIQNSRIQMVKYLAKKTPAVLEQNCAEEKWEGKPITMKNMTLDMKLELISLGARLNSEDSKGRNLLHLTARYGTANDFSQIINRIREVSQEVLPDLVNSKDFVGLTPLHLYVYHKDATSEMIKLFYELGANFGSYHQEGETIFITAVISSMSIETLKSLVEYGANRTSEFNPRGIRDPKNCVMKYSVDFCLPCPPCDSTYLECPPGYLCSAEYLSEGCTSCPSCEDPCSNQETGDSCKAVYKDADNIYEYNLMNALHAAVGYNNLDAVKYLLDIGYDINAKLWPYGDTALDIAIRNNNTDAVSLLLDNNANIQAGRYPFYYTAKYLKSQSSIIFQLLRKKQRLPAC